MSTLSLTEEVLGGLELSYGQVEFYDSQFNVPGSFGVRVGAGGRKSFFLVVRVRGKRKRMTIGQWPILDVETARRQAQEIVEQVLAGRDPVAEAKHYRKLPSFGNAAEEYLKHAAQRCKPRTINEYRRLLTKEILPIWSDVCIVDISSEEINRLLAECALERGRIPLANRIRALVSAVMNYCIERRYISSNPVTATASLVENREVPQLLSLEELQLVWGYLGQTRGRHAIALKLLIATLQRVQLVLNMRWADIQIDSWRPNPDSDRAIHIHTHLLAALRQLQNTNTGYDHVFADSLGVCPRDLRKLCKEISTEFNIPNLSPSLLRSSAEIELVKLKTRPAVMAYICGRQTVLKQLLKHGNVENYFSESQKVYAKWIRKLTGDYSPKTTKGKIIPLFSDNEL